MKWNQSSFSAEHFTMNIGRFSAVVKREIGTQGQPRQWIAFFNGNWQERHNDEASAKAAAEAHARKCIIEAYHIIIDNI